MKSIILGFTISTANFLDAIISLKFLSADLRIWMAVMSVTYLVALIKLPIPTILMSIGSVIFWWVLS